MLRAGLILQGGEHLFFLLSHRATLKHTLGCADLACLLLGWNATQHPGKVISWWHDDMSPCNGDLKSLSGSPPFTHPPSLLHGYKKGTGFFVFLVIFFNFFSTAALEIKHVLVRRFAGLSFQRGSAAGCRMEVTKLQRGNRSREGGMAGGAPHTRGHSWAGSVCTCTAWASERERELGKLGWDQAAAALPKANHHSLPHADKCQI